MTIKKTPISCDWRAGKEIKKTKSTAAANKSRLYKHKGFKWQGIKVERYKSDKGNWADIVRQTLIGSHGETPMFHLRYFEIAPGGYSSFEKHRHEHVVICVRGKGKVLAGKKLYAMDFMDTLYVAPDTPHQLKNPFKKPFGFFCIVNAKRDRPKILSSPNL